jgi:CubicO group peptidase (beta-lactamase class C family)
LGCVAAAWATTPVSAADRRAAAIDALFAEVDKPESPGCAVGVIEDGKLTFAKGYGRASLEQGTPITPRTVFDLGSVSKQFMAATVMLLVEDRVLSLDDDVRKFLPELAQIGSERITLRSMLHHTSGLRDYIGLLLMAGWRYEDWTTAGEALSLLARQRGLDFSPGTRYSYSDTNYFLLSQVVERATGKPWRELAAQRLFAPLGMTHTEVLDDHTRVVPGRAASYEPRLGSGFALATSAWDQTGDGAVETSIEDLARWEANFATARVGGSRLVREMETPGRLTTGETIQYGLGLFLDHYRGLLRIGHNGDWLGYRASLWRFPVERTSVAVLCNVSSIDAAERADRVIDEVLAGKFRAVSGFFDTLASLLAPSTSISPPPAEAFGAPGPIVPEDFAGLYWSPELGVSWRIEVERGTLVLRHRVFGDPTLAPVGPNVFRAGPMRLTFAPGTGPRTGFDVAIAYTRDVHFGRRPMPSS